jgi:hypothetical protein
VEIEGITSPIETGFKFQSHQSADARLREIEVNGSRVLLFECRSCGRGFGREDAESRWRAVRVGPFRVAWLPDEVTAEWSAEPCPAKLADIAPPTISAPMIAPTSEMVEASRKRRGRPPKVRSLLRIKPWR